MCQPPNVWLLQAPARRACISCQPDAMHSTCRTLYLHKHCSQMLAMAILLTAIECWQQVTMHVKMRHEAESLLSALWQAQVHLEDEAFEHAVLVQAWSAIACASDSYGRCACEGISMICAASMCLRRD